MSGGRSKGRTPALPGQGKNRMLAPNKTPGFNPGHQGEQP